MVLCLHVWLSHQTEAWHRPGGREEGGRGRGKGEGERRGREGGIGEGEGRGKGGKCVCVCVNPITYYYMQ